LGKELIRESIAKNFSVLAQYHTKKIDEFIDCKWIQADFSSLEGIRRFLNVNRSHFQNCQYLINNYGPITSKDLDVLNGEDLLGDFHHNLITAFEITNFFINQTALKSVVTIGFGGVGQTLAYKKVLPYAIAKNSMLLLNTSWVQKYRQVRFNMVSPEGIAGAEIKSPKHIEVDPGDIAQTVLNLLLGNESGKNVLI